VTSAAPATSAFREALDEHLAALQARDAARFAATLGDDAAVVDGGGAITRGTDAVLRSHAEWFDAPEPWTFAYELVLARETPTAGLALIDVTYRHTPDAEPARFLLSLVFERGADGAYKLVYDQNTPLR
jgi:ketosteroid isomerase-like protein